MICSPDIRIDLDRLIVPPQDSAAEEARDKNEAIVKLYSRTGHIQFIEKPMDIHERVGHFVQDEV